MRKQFRPNPLRGDARAVLYYTGDRGRYRPDGTLAVVGRLDDQLKIRGVPSSPTRWPHRWPGTLARTEP